MGTVVTATGNVSNITGGTLAGSNLFHSFSSFTVGTGATADFNVSSGVSNILARVTGGGASTIDGTITSTLAGGGLSSANLFLINPAGLMFTGNAQVNLGGSFVATTASYVKFSDGSTFYGDVNHPTQDAGLTTMPVSSFGFMPGAAYSPISIASGATFSATGLQFVGGDFSTGANVSLTVPGANSVIGVFSGAAGSSTVDATVPYLTSPTSTYSTAANLPGYGNVTLGDSTGGSTVSATGTGSSVVIRGGHLVQNTKGTLPGAASLISATRSVSLTGTSLTQSGTISSATGSVGITTTGANSTGTYDLTGGTLSTTSGNVSVHATGTITLTNGAISTTTGSIGIDTTNDVSLLTGTITSAGGAINLGQLQMTNLTLDSGSAITETEGTNGTLTLNSTGEVNNGGTISTVGSSQNVQIAADSLALGGTISTNAASITVDMTHDATLTDGTITSAGGSITLGHTSMANLTLDGTSSITDTAGTTGNLIINTTNEVNNGGTISTVGASQTLRITADSLALGGTLSTQAANLSVDTTHDTTLTGGMISTQGGTITLGGSSLVNLTLSPDSSSNNSTISAEHGVVNVTASGNITLNGGTIESTSSTSGDAKSVTVSTSSGDITLNSGAVIGSVVSTAGSGNAGNVSVTDTAGNITLNSNAQIASIINSNAQIASIINSTTSTTTAGSVTVTDNAGAIALNSGGQIASISNNNGSAGNVTVNATAAASQTTSALAITGTGASTPNSGIFSLATGTGTAGTGNVAVTANGNVTLSLGGQIATVVNGTNGGNAGAVTVTLNTANSNLTVGGTVAETSPSMTATPTPIIYSLTANPASTDAAVTINALLSNVTLQSGAVIQTSSQDTTAGDVDIKASALTLDADSAIQSVMSQATGDTNHGHTGAVNVLVLNPTVFPFAGALSIDSSAFIQTVAKPAGKNYDPLGQVTIEAGSLTEGGSAAVQDNNGVFTQVSLTNPEIRMVNTTTFGAPNASDPSAARKPIIQNLFNIPEIFFLFGNLFGNSTPPPPPAGEGLVLDGTLGGTANEIIPDTFTDGTYIYTITPTYGTIAGGNLFLSFSEFNLGLTHPDPTHNPTEISPVSEEALFDTTGFSIQNILVRVTGGSESEINGKLAEAADTTANIFFLNSNGVAFTNNSSLSLNGALTISTANDIQFSTGGTFTSSFNGAADLVLKNEPSLFTGTVADFGFTGGTTPGAVTFSAATLSNAATNGTSASQIQVIAGDISLTNGTLLDASQVFLFSAGSSVNNSTLSFIGNNSLATFPSSLATPGAFTSVSQVATEANFDSLGTVTLSGGSVISVPTPNFAATIAIRAADFNLNDSKIVDQTTADTGSKGGTVLVDLTDTASISSTTDSSFISTSTLGTSDAGSVQINAQNLDITGNSQNIFATGIFSTAEPASYYSSDVGYIVYQSYGNPATASGNAGAITINVSGSIDVSTVGQISTNTNGRGNAGTITIAGLARPNDPTVYLPQITLSSGGSITSSTSLDNPAFARTGNAGTVNINASSLTVSGSLLGNPSLIATSAGTAVNTAGPTGNAGTVNIRLTDQTGAGNGDLLISNGGQLSSSSYNNGQGGTVVVDQISAAVGITINGGGLNALTGIFASEYSTGSSQGNTSEPSIKVTTPTALLVEAGGEISSSAADTGNAGAISVESGNLTIDGTNANAAQITGILSSSTGDTLTGFNSTVTGNGGDITVQVTGDLDVLTNGAISASSATVGSAGTIKITQAGSTDIVDPSTNPTTNGGIFIKGGSISTAAAAPGSLHSTTPNPGEITLNMQALTVGAGGTITSSTSGASNAGNIMIQGESTAAKQFVNVQNGGVIASNTSNSGVGGSITINVQQAITVTNGSQIASGTSGSGNGGTIVTHSGSLAVNGTGSTISTSASGGTGGGGNITLTINGNSNVTGANGDVTVANGGAISASSQTTGKAGTIEITQGNSQDLAAPVLNSTTLGGLYVNNGVITTAANGPGSTTTLANAGNLTLNVEALTMTNNGLILSSTSGASKAGDVAIDLTGPGSSTQFVVLQNGAKIASETGGSGGGGQVSITTKSLFVDDARISTSATGGSGNAGDIFLTATSTASTALDAVSIQDGGTVLSASDTTGAAGMITIQASQTSITGAGSTISTDAGSLGLANNSLGEIIITGQSLTIADSGLVSATTGGFSRGGSITINATNQVAITGNGEIDASSTAATGGGNGGSVSIGSDPMTSQEDYGTHSPYTVSLFNGGTISADSQNTNGGNITIHANDVSLVNDGLISTNEPNGAPDTVGGNITMRVGNTLYLNNNSFINSNAGQGTGGNIYIDPQFTVLNHSGISASGGLANGNVTIDSTFVLSGTSFIIATGTVSIDSVPLDLAGSLIALPANLTSEERRLREKCARAINHEFSSLIVVGRGGTESAPEELQPDFGDLPQSSQTQ
jgi:fibronectin-binding autotransporter adhesin